MRQSVRPSVCLYVTFSDSFRSLDGDMRAWPFQTRLKGDSTVGYARISKLSAARYLIMVHIVDGSFHSRYRVLSSTTADWRTMRVGGLSAEVTSLTLHQLQPETVYEFTVLARNRLGDGLFSDVTRARTKGRCWISPLCCAWHRLVCLFIYLFIY